MKFPEMRKELVEYLEGLGDKTYQYSCWVKKECPEGIENDELDYAVHFFEPQLEEQFYQLSS